MNTKQAKQISIEKLLNLLSHALAKEIRGELWYYSPFRTEKEPSFKVNPEKNIWYDFGEGLGGNVLYFIMRFYNIADVSFALLKLSEILGIEGEQSEAIIISPRQSKVSQISVKRQKIDRIQSLENRSLIQYLRKRGISKETAAPYVKEKILLHKKSTLLLLSLL
jgi:DNA primase